MMYFISFLGGKDKFSHPYDYDPFTVWKGRGTPDGSLYTDRLYQWDSAKHNELCLKHFGNVGQYWGDRAPAKIQEFLRDYLGKPNLVLCEIQEHCNASSGYPCWYFSYQENTK